MIGTTLRQRYQITQRLGAGGFGETYLAEDLGIPVTPKPKRVVKHLKPQQQHPAIKRLFEQEGAILYKLGQHNQIPQLFEYFEDNGQFFLIQEYIEGQDLESEIQQSQQIWTEAQVIEFLQEMLEILSFVHSHNIIHRDIKPANIMRRKQDNKLVLIDFCIVKELSTTRINSRGQTMASISIGTPGYMASEQGIGKPRLSSDVYALGKTAIELLTGVFPDLLSEDEQGEIIWRNRVNISSKLADFLTKMVRYHFKDRFVNATAALQEFSALFSATSSTPNLPLPQPQKLVKAISIPTKTENFTAVKVNSQGTIINRRQASAEVFSLDLGKGISLDMVYIPGGTFIMGAPKSEKGSQDNERPQHKVTVQPFWMGKYAITQKQWRQLTNLPKLQRDLEPNPSRFKGDNRPVEKVNWYDAVEFCARLSVTTNRQYCLPSEAQWEYACRAGTTTPFHLGETITTEITNYNGNYTYADEPKGEYRQETAPVGSFPPNSFGLCEMHGNVWEWCADPRHDNYNGAPTDGKVWDEKCNDNRYQNYAEYLTDMLNDKSNKILRGGSWDHFPWYCRSAYRNYSYPDGRVNIYFNYGFRVVCVAPRTL
ncbi:MAG: SUMF1/EgtB/PvdO family nonheme iron enzyme [Spirulinaceae cyanobacterium]